MNIEFLIKKKSYEKILYVLRRDNITFVPKILLLVILFLLPVAIYFMIDSIYPDLILNKALYASAVLGGGIYYLSILLFFYTAFVDFYLDVWIVTNDRIVDIEQFGLFSRTVSELDLFRIQDVTVDVHGFFPTMFHYGNLSVKTASTNLNIVFKNIPHPNKVRQELLRLTDADFKFHRGQ